MNASAPRQEATNSAPLRNPLRHPRLALAINADERHEFLGPWLQRLSSRANIVGVAADGPSAIKILQMCDPEVLLTAWSTPWLEPLLANSDCRVGYICHLTGSVRNVVPRSFLERGGKVTNWGTQASAAVAEHGLLLALAALRNLPAWDVVIAGARKTWAARELRTRTLVGRRVGIHGFGSVAHALIDLLRPFDVSIMAYSAAVPLEAFRARGVAPAPSLDTLFSQSEVLFECEALTPQTAKAVTAQTLALLGDDAVFVNVGRGELVDESALLREATSGRIRIALDVIASEPLTPLAPLYDVDGAVLSPHIAGPTYDLYHRIGEYAVANIERFIANEPLTGSVTLEIFDRST